MCCPWEVLYGSGATEWPALHAVPLLPCLLLWATPLVAASAGVAAHLQSKGKGKKMSSGKMAFASPAPLGGKHLGGLHSFKMDSTTIEPTLRPSVLSDPDRDLGDDPSRWEEPSMIAGTAEPKRAAREGSVLTNQI